LARAVEEANGRVARHSAATVRFEIHEDSGDPVILVVDHETDELIRQIPPEEIIRIGESIEQLRGLLFDRQG
jgi:flagellar protein FlaG